MDLQSPPLCPKTVTVRRNPPRRARPTPYSAAPSSQPPPSKTSTAIRSFPIEDILAIEIPEKPEILESSSPKEALDSEKLKVFLRIRPIVTQQKVGGLLKNGGQKNVWPQNPRKKDALKMAKAGGKKAIETCLKANDSHSVTLCPPQSLTDARRSKSEVYEGFSHVFGDDSSQTEVYERMMNPLVEEFLKGKSGMLAAMGPSGSGKTHTVFGSTRQPGMVSLALRRIFSQNESSGSKSSRTFYLSMFEIYSERGKGEKIMDLSEEGGDLHMQQSSIKGLKEVAMHDVQQAESLIANGMLKRSTAMTNSNIQSSRSQCIINICLDLHDLVEDGFSTAVLTIVDLAGAEREKRTGNQGARLLESNFINNTSMVFGLCLRSLLEHQKNPKKPLHKHFQNSMLTKYLRDFLEGKKRMALILTVKPGEEDYHDTCYLLRQASPFMNIKFESIEEQPLGNKRRTQVSQKSQISKRVKLNSNETCVDDEVKGGTIHQSDKEELDKEVETIVSPIQSPIKVNIDENKNQSVKESIIDLTKKARENQILSGFSRALWKVLREYKNKLEASEHEVDSLRHSLTASKEQCAALETQLELMKASCRCGKQSSDEVASTSLNVPNLEKQRNEENNDPCDYVLFDKEDLIELGDTGFNNDIAGYDKLESGVSDLKLLSHGDAVPFLTKGDQREHKEEESNAQDSSSDLTDSECFEKQDILDNTVTIDHELSPVGVISINGDPEKFEEQSKGVLEEKDSLFVKGDQQHEEDSNAQFLTSNSSESKCFEKPDIVDDTLNAQGSSSDLSDSESFEKQDILDNTVTIDHELSPVGVISIHGDIEKFEEQSEEVHEEKDSSFVKGDQQHDKDSNTQVSSSNSSESKCFEKPDIVDDTGISSVEVASISGDVEKFEDESKEKVEERDFNGEATGTDEVSSSLEEVQPEREEKEEAPEKELVLSEDVTISPRCNDHELAEVPAAQPCQPSMAVKPKRRLRPASSVMLKNINMLDADDATAMPKQHRQGKRDENEEGRKRTQGSISLLRILKQNLHR